MTKTSPSSAAAAVKDRMNVEKAADYLGCSESHLNNMRSQGRGPRYLRLGKRVFYRASDLDAYVERAVVETADSRAA